MIGGAISLIKKARKILLLTHKDAYADGDALGSLLSLYLSFKKINKNPIALMPELPASNFRFLPGIKELDNKQRINFKEVDLIIFLDVAEIDRVVLKGDLLKRTLDKKPSILIDHHEVGNLHRIVRQVIWDNKASSTTELLYYLLNALPVCLDREIATCLFTGIFTDTNSFLNPNTSIRSLEVSSCLLNKGVRIDHIVRHVFKEKEVKMLNLWGYALSRIRENKKYNFYFTIITERDLQNLQVGPESVSGIVNFLNLVADQRKKGVLVLVEENGKIKGSLRTTKEGIDLSKLANYLGGGGHQKASGFTLDGKLQIIDNKWRVT